MKTIPLYDNDAFAKEFDANVVSCTETDGKYDVVLDQTLFFPEQGGQTSDIGVLADAKVLDVQISDEEIHHICDRSVSGQVHGIIDWAHRFNNMQQHSGEHVFTGLAHNKYGAENVGFHLSNNTVTLDLDIELDEKAIRDLERLSNLIVAEDKKISCYYPDAESLSKLNYRSKKEIKGNVRIVEIEDTDFCACCAPHVKSTGQIGIIKVVSFGKYKGGTRVYILCGLRALSDYNHRMDILSKSYQALSCSENELPDKIAKIMDDNKQLGYKMAQIKSDILLQQIEKYPSDMEDVIIFGSDLDSKSMRDGVNILMEKHAGLSAIFSGDDENGYNFVIGSKNRDCAAIAAGLREMLGAKGGGSKQMAQGSIKATEAEIRNTI